jgi:hypothetical protein
MVIVSKSDLGSDNLSASGEERVSMSQLFVAYANSPLQVGVDLKSLLMSVLLYSAHGPLSLGSFCVSSPLTDTIDAVSSYCP